MKIGDATSTVQSHSPGCCSNRVLLLKSDARERLFSSARSNTQSGTGCSLWSDRSGRERGASVAAARRYGRDDDDQCWRELCTAADASRTWIRCMLGDIVFSARTGRGGGMRRLRYPPRRGGPRPGDAARGALAENRQWFAASPPRLSAGRRDWHTPKEGRPMALANERVAWFNGKIVRESEVLIPFRDQGFLRGDAVFDMTRSFNGKAFRLEEHVARLYRSLKYLDLDPGVSPAGDGGDQRRRARPQPPSFGARRGLLAGSAGQPRHPPGAGRQLGPLRAERDRRMRAVAVA